MPSLNNVTTQDDYTDATTLECPMATRFVLVVNNAAIYYKQTFPVGTAPKGAPFEQEVFLIPGVYPIYRRTTRVAVRSAVAGTPAQVTINAYP